MTHKLMAHLFYSNTWTPLKDIHVEVYQNAAGSYYSIVRKHFSKQEDLILIAKKASLS